MTEYFIHFILMQLLACKTVYFVTKHNIQIQNRFYFVAKKHININYVSFLLFAIVQTGSCEETNGLQVKQQHKFKFYV